MKYAIEFLMVVLMVVILFMTIFGLITYKMVSDREKYSTFECGMDLMNNLRIPFSLHFFFVSIIFLIFDVELMLILPFIFCLKFYYSTYIMFFALILFGVLIIGVLYEWLTGLLNWMI